MSEGGFKVRRYFVKDMDVDCHPYYYNCPKKLVDMVEMKSDMARAWKEAWSAKQVRKIA